MAEVTDRLTLDPDERREVVRLLAEIDAAGVGASGEVAADVAATLGATPAGAENRS